MNDEPNYASFLGVSLPKVHSTGRREDREAFRSQKGYYVPRPDGKPGTMPIKRAEPKRGGLTKKQFKKMKREQREISSES